jgi:16S rRNA (cytosine967-C5)-methyltransferase
MVTLLISLNRMSKDLSDAIIMVFGDNVYVTKAIMSSFKNHKDWNDEMRGLFSDTVYDIVRYWRLLWYLLKKKPSLERRDLQHLISVYIFYKERRTSETEVINYNELVKTLDYAKSVRVLRESIPDWLDRVGVNEIGKRWDSVIKSLNQRPNTVVRANTLKVTKDELVKILEDEGVRSEKIDWAPDALVLRDRTNVFKLRSFRDGFFEVQNAASQIVSRFLGPKSRMRVVDACAGEGSKTIHLAALMNNRGKIIAMDTQEWRLKELRKRAARAGADNIEIRFIGSSKAYKRLDETADRLLLDVPCSGLGTLRRNPDIKWKLNLSDLQRLKEVQRDLLDKYCTILKAGGRMVYSVCSILPSEGEEQIRDFIKRQNDKFQLVEERRYWPDAEDADGFYMALIERK